MLLSLACTPADPNKVQTHNVTGHRVTAQLLLSLTWGERRFTVIHYRDHGRLLETQFPKTRLADYKADMDLGTGWVKS
jgi:hypothetical protein